MSSAISLLVMEEEKQLENKLPTDDDDLDKIGLVMENIKLGLKLDGDGKEHSILHSWKDVARRALMFDYCKVEPSINDADIQEDNGKNDYQTVNEIVSKEAWNEELEDRPRRQSVSNPFHFAAKPIEKIVRLNEEVDLERQTTPIKDLSPSRLRSQSASLGRQVHGFSSDPSVILEEEEEETAFEDNAKALPSPPPFFQRVSLVGDNVSGVCIYMYIIRKYKKGMNTSYLIIGQTLGLGGICEPLYPSIPKVETSTPRDLRVYCV